MKRNSKRIFNSEVNIIKVKCKTTKKQLQQKNSKSLEKSKFLTKIFKCKKNVSKQSGLKNSLKKRKSQKNSKFSTEISSSSATKSPRKRSFNNNIYNIDNFVVNSSSPAKSKILEKPTQKKIFKEPVFKEIDFYNEVPNSTETELTSDEIYEKMHHKLETIENYLKEQLGKRNLLD